MAVQTAPPTPQHAVPTAPGWATLTRFVAFLLPLLLGADIPIMVGLTVGTALSLALTPVWFPYARKVTGTGVLLLVVLLCLCSAPVLTWWSSQSHAVNPRTFVVDLASLIGCTAGVGALLWCARIHSVGVMACMFGIGIYGSIPGTERFAEEPWRFGFAFPTTIVLLALCMIARRTWLEVAVMMGLGVMGAVSGGRSYSAMLLMAVVLVVWQRRPQFKRRASSAIGALIMVGLLGLGVYRALTGAAVDGYLGESAQQRTQAQLAQSGSLILGGRPESGATLALLEHRPLGFGSGVKPTLEDILVAKRGMAELGYDPNNGYVEEYMFGLKIELHSLLGDFWAVYGIAGILLAASLVWLSLHYVGRSLAYRAGTALGLFLSLRLLWDVFFSPILSTRTHLMLALAVLLLALTEERRSVRRHMSRDQRRPVAGGKVGRHIREARCDVQSLPDVVHRQ